ncbi:Sodium/hydrogen exchanger family-domain-containing protein [Tribonema minus]|uniref:Sodium/hydrogen exchanger 8 n=1 Tax=Tribonema minus TaxID=303371 RepID=A0A835YL00_9STRA|nr:Sodium/hydrogen exchanger family-domain-containing protein [Tribonema minus]
MAGLFGYEFGIHDQESATTAFVLVFLILLVSVLVLADHVVGHLLNHRLRFQIPESGVTMFIGVVIGGVIALLSETAKIGDNPLISFSPTIFFLAFLPPIIYNEGYNLRQQFFFGYIKEILIFAIIGTALSAFIMAIFLYKIPGRPAGSVLSFAEASAFGGLVTSTDPVAVLAILGQLRVEPALFFLVFGESVLNDAEVGAGIADFIIICLGSCVIGFLVPCISTYVLKRAELRGHVVLELSVYLLMSYVPYVLAQIVGMSGIVAILVAGVTMRTYTHRNLSSRHAQEYADFFYRICAYLADNAVFLYLGMSVFGLHIFVENFDVGYVCWALFACLVSRGVSVVVLSGNFEEGYVCWALFACLVSRAVSVVVLSVIINVLVPYTNLNRVAYKNQFVLWFAGLRGAVAFAAASNFTDVSGKHGIVVTTTMGIVIVYNFIMAPLTMPIIKSLGMPMNVKYENSQPPRMPRLGRWVYQIDRKYIDTFLICKCAQRGAPCEAYHDEFNCPLLGNGAANATPHSPAPAALATTPTKAHDAHARRPSGITERAFELPTVTAALQRCQHH